MINLLKTFGKGLLYVIGLPFFLVALAIFGAIGLIAFIFQIIKSIIYFFTGHKFFPELPEDAELRMLRENANKVNQEEQIVPQNNDTPSIISAFKAEEPAIQPAPVVETPPVANTVEQACFKDQISLEDLVDEEEEKVQPIIPEPDPVPEVAPIFENTVQDEQVEEEETLLESTSEEEKDDDEFIEELETYVPRSSNYSATEGDEDDNDTDSGVNIDFNL